MKILIFLISFLLISCSSYKVKTYYDEFDHYEWYRFENNVVSENYPGIDIEINPQKWIQGETVVYSLQIKLVGSKELEISENQLKFSEKMFNSPGELIFSENVGFRVRRPRK